MIKYLFLVFRRLAGANVNSKVKNPKAHILLCVHIHMYKICVEVHMYNMYTYMYLLALSAKRKRSIAL